jgi:hypothetical protein
VAEAAHGQGAFWLMRDLRPPPARAYDIGTLAAAVKTAKA